MTELKEGDEIFVSKYPSILSFYIGKVISIDHTINAKGKYRIKVTTGIMEYTTWYSREDLLPTKDLSKERMEFLKIYLSYR